MPSRIGAPIGLTFLARPWRIAVYALVGIAIGLAIVIARISNAASYLSDSPQTCMNCHVMTDDYVSCQRGSHGRVTVCIDCHVPHDNPVAKIAFKSTDGLKHSAVFTMRTEPQVLRLSTQAVPVVQANCVRCHADQLSMVRGWALRPRCVRPGRGRRRATRRGQATAAARAVLLGLHSCQ